MKDKILLHFYEDGVPMIWESFKTVYRKDNTMAESSGRRDWNSTEGKEKSQEDTFIGGSSIFTT